MDSKETRVAVIVKSFAVDKDGQGRSYKTNFLYCSRPVDAGKLVGSLRIDGHTPCKATIIVYLADGSEKKVEKRVRSWEAVMCLYGRMCVATPAA